MDLVYLVSYLHDIDTMNDEYLAVCIIATPFKIIPWGYQG